MYWFSIRTNFASLKIQGFSILLCVYIAYQFSYEPQYNLTFAIIYAMIIYIVFWLFQIVFAAFLLATKKNRAMFSAQEIELIEDGIIERNEFQELKVFWGGVVHIKDSYRAVAIYFTEMQAILIPNRAFSSKEHKARFVDFIRERTNGI